MSKTAGTAFWSKFKKLGRTYFMSDFSILTQIKLYGLI